MCEERLVAPALSKPLSALCKEIFRLDRREIAAYFPSDNPYFFLAVFAQEKTLRIVV